MNNSWNKTACITGANSGIGLELTKRLLAENWRIIALNRSLFPENEQGIKEAIHQGQLTLYRADLSDFIQLKAVLGRVKSEVNAIDVLFNNAGISLSGPEVSKQGREIHYEVNSVVPYIIVMELKSLLMQGAMKTIINTSSNASLMVKQFDSETWGQVQKFRKLLGPYASSKLALSLWTEQAALRFAEESIRMISVCPGPNKTPMTMSDGMPAFMRPFVHLLFQKPIKGASRLYEAAFEPRYNRSSGAFLVKGKPVQPPFAQHGPALLAQIDAIYRQVFIRESLA
ncbi:SDR family NAD(P)-dependent oxidoreductase [Paenibacillus eucommiae]|uniref:NAD(P)-dependent dehydrogenase (Short-subunit alcohol dehydrogenase family) n=1 Tax=Paenibacillus eucommiae TaxID=1355755 RepID=A0ABS4IVJ9_9BACL|nr:SDR family NAD(P)-dependent oxidoreductase [Paenibacillus eucommiae]MBP1991610.1 NAD(P)-dependent dehydrogenase (short-subunit alcohol dehydrogenase family) [Paenibacillus eucommiae]